MEYAIKYRLQYGSPIMNKTIEKFVRKILFKKLSRCTKDQILFFKRLYSHQDLEKDTKKIVDEMPLNKLDWALSQVEATIEKNKKKLHKVKKQFNIYCDKAKNQD